MPPRRSRWTCRRVGIGLPIRGLVDGLDEYLSSSVFDSMNFLNEVAHRHPEAISYAAGGRSTSTSTTSTDT
jgi:hypothetical protein